MPVMTAAEIDALMQEAFSGLPTDLYRIEAVEDHYVRVRMPFRNAYLRPGGTLSGPSLMTLVDTAMYYAVLAMIGPVPLAVTTNLNINFMRRPEPADVIAECRLLKLGSRLAVGDVAIRSEGGEDMVAHATCTYSIPPPEARQAANNTAAGQGQ